MSDTQVQGTATVLGALQQLQDAVLATSMGEAGVRDVSTKLSQLSIHLQALLQRHSVFERSCSDRALAEKALRNVISSKEAEAARLRAEITRLRHHLQLSADMEQQQQSETPAQEAACDPAARQAVLAAAVAARDKPLAVVAQLESEVSACHVRIDALESDLAAAAVDNNSRLAEQQNAFLMKLEQLRQVHSQQLAAASQAAQVVEQQHTKAIHKLEQQLNSAEGQGHKLQELVVSLEQQVQHLQHQLKAKPSVETDHSSREQEVVHCSTTSTKGAVEYEDAASTLTAPSVASKQADASALQLMEEQLARLSSIIKAHQAENLQLRQTIMEGFTERQLLQRQLQELQMQHSVQQQVLSLPGPAQNAKLGTAAARSATARTKPKSGGIMQGSSKKI